jgi:hypothetical protein
MGCPDYPSQSRSPSANQNSLGEMEKQSLKGSAATYASQARVCSYCGLVYVDSLPGRPPQRLGWLEGYKFTPT